MALWSVPEESLRDRAAQSHRKTYNADPTILTTAPGTIPLVGEHTDYIGGVVVVAMSHLGVAVAASPRPDNKVQVRLSQFDGTRFKDTSTTTNMDSVAQRKPGAIEQKLGGVVWSLVNRQMLSRETQGFNITVVSTIPPHCGLGEAEAMATAFALGLQIAANAEIDAPLRARLAEVCAQSATVFADTPELRARHIAALRGHPKSVALVDYADGSVTQAPHPRELDLFIVAQPKPKGPTELVSEITRRHTFLDDAARAYGVDSLRALPDAPSRVTDWLSAVHKVHGPDKGPGIEEAAHWLQFLSEETRRASEAAAALRSRRMNAVLELARTSQHELENKFNLATETNRALVYLCESRGAQTARSTAPGMFDAVLAYVNPKHSHNFAADLSEDGLLVIPTYAGTPTE
ncbi:galactokinase family protein [Corynebacterium freiburgense]|uniref:galactokinase family protein n=1 Tax=Corynebacterium freiburgense TaxID=556548 RepID=UPI00041C328D|nr:galactokinase family protein [Corynebacterium freiburgense]WJZ03233.1 galactokinase [Corynebacterium freiburgense]